MYSAHLHLATKISNSIKKQLKLVCLCYLWKLLIIYQCMSNDIRFKDYVFYLQFLYDQKWQKNCSEVQKWKDLWSGIFSAHWNFYQLVWNSSVPQNDNSERSSVNKCQKHPKSFWSCFFWKCQLYSIEYQSTDHFSTTLIYQKISAAVVDNDNWGALALF